MELQLPVLISAGHCSDKCTVFEHKSRDNSLTIAYTGTLWVWQLFNVIFKLLQKKSTIFHVWLPNSPPKSICGNSQDGESYLQYPEENSSNLNWNTKQQHHNISKVDIVQFLHLHCMQVWLQATCPSISPGLTGFTANCRLVYERGRSTKEMTLFWG